jgi:predicted esterase
MIEDFRHRFITSPTTKPNTKKQDKDQLGGEIKYHMIEPLTLLLLHGTGGNEDDLIPIGQKICPSASLLSPRGKVLENGMPRFFKRLSEGVFDMEDLKYRTTELADFLKEASKVYSFDLSKTIAVGFSNGANIATSVLISYPKVLAGAILFRAMVPFVPDSSLDLSEKKVFLSAGRFDPMVSENQTMDLFEILKKNKAQVLLKWQQSGHNLIEADIIDSKYWITENFY